MRGSIDEAPVPRVDRYSCSVTPAVSEIDDRAHVHCQVNWSILNVKGDLKNETRC